MISHFVRSNLMLQKQEVPPLPEYHAKLEAAAELPEEEGSCSGMFQAPPVAGG